MPMRGAHRSNTALRPPPLTSRTRRRLEAARNGHLPSPGQIGSPNRWCSPLRSQTARRRAQFNSQILKWSDNATNDAARAAKGYTATLAPSSYASIPVVTTSTPSGSTTVSQLGGPQNVVFMHGLFSSGNTWNRMEPWLNQDFRFGPEITPSYSSTSSLSNQGTSLVSEIKTVGGNNYILIGHSQGGLISRYAAQYFQSNPPNQVAGVVTVDTPHLGADLIQNGPLIAPASYALGTFLWDWTGCVTQWENFVCLLAWLDYNVGPPMGAVFAALPVLPDINDLTPGSAFLTSLNGYGETFKRASVVGNTPQRWNESRIAWDFLAPYIFPPVTCDPNYYPESACGERTVAAGVGITYDIVEAVMIFAVFEQIFCPDNDNWGEIEYLAGILAGMDGIDVLWNLIVSGYGASDGIVQSSSQNYPSSTAIQYPINGADSHLEATHSPYDHTTLDQVLESAAFQVPTQASCSFAMSPSNFSISPSGGTSSFSLATGAGCPWSAVSQEAWLTITSGTSGTSSGTVSFSVAPNPAAFPRTATIQAGNGLVSATFTVNQVGACSYSLSSQLVVLSPGGGTGTVTVNTQTGCVWSAVPNTTWITLNSGASGTASGTGSGSFTFTAATGNDDVSFSGTITVMSQILTVVVGSSVGTPGTGTLTVAGHPESYEPCYHCALIWESGSVYANIAGVTFSASYSGTTPTSASVATALASSINAASSPVSATVSGSVITIKSKENGAVTNYSLSTSYSYNAGDFTSPAFTAAPSGSSLTGGTD